MAYDPMAYQQAASGAVDLGTKIATQEIGRAHV